MWRHYIYIHFKESDGVPFYVGKGAMRVRQKTNTYERACDPNRNNHWKNIVNKHGLVINIIMSCKTDEEAQEQEKRIILAIGRLDLGTGTLINKTDGGEGHAGIIMSEETRKKHSINASKIRSLEWVASIRAARKNGGNGGVVKFGDKLPENWRASIAAAKIGNKNPMYGKTTKIARKVIDANSGNIYKSVTEAAKDFELNMKTLYNMLSGHRANNTPLRFEDGL